VTASLFRSARGSTRRDATPGFENYTSGAGQDDWCCASLGRWSSN
jgi:hypothetical protein